MIKVKKKRGVQMKRSKILCPNCFKSKLLEMRKDECLCDKCGQEYKRSGEMSVKFK